MKVDFQKATLQQLMQIIKHEECTIAFKCRAETELMARAGLLKS